ncbi:MAG: TrgA family protein [Rhodobacteraceae bacterium]|jgi:hypothetical protein|nr:TrgA family protein [Paracoccaceae bacterium]
MPTAAKLVSALFFAFLGYFAADMVKPVLPEGTQVAMFSPMCALIGLACGWKMVGERAGDGMWPSAGYGLTTSMLIVFWSLLLFSGNEMLQRSIRRHYDGAVDAILGMVSIAIGNLMMIATPTVIATLVIGGIFGGYLSEFAARRWR